MQGEKLLEDACKMILEKFPDLEDQITNGFNLENQVGETLRYWAMKVKRSCKSECSECDSDTDSECCSSEAAASDVAGAFLTEIIYLSILYGFFWRSSLCRLAVMYSSPYREEECNI